MNQTTAKVHNFPEDFVFPCECQKSDDDVEHVIVPGSINISASKDRDKLIVEMDFKCTTCGDIKTYREVFISNGNFEVAHDN